MTGFDSETANYIIPRDDDDPYLNPERRTKVSAAGFRTFVNIADRWGITEDERRRILGGLTLESYNHYATFAASRRDFTLDIDELERISLVIGIFADVATFVGDAEAENAWLRARIFDSFFRGRRPLELIVGGSLNSLWGLRRQLRAVSAGN